MMKSNSRIFGSLIFATFVLFASFQNCTAPHYSAVSQPSITSANAGGGSNGGFDGKPTYAVKGNCPDGKGPESRLVVARDYRSATLVRDKCADIPLGNQVTVPSSKFAFKDEKRLMVAYQARTYSLEDSNLAPAALETAWICIGRGSLPNGVKILRDPHVENLYYNQFSGLTPSQQQAWTDYVAATKEESPNEIMIGSAPYEASSTGASLASIKVRIPNASPSSSASASVQLSSDGEMTLPMDCAAPSAAVASTTPTPTPNPTPLPTATPIAGGAGSTGSTPNPAPTSTPSLRWIFFTQATPAQIQYYQIPHCSPEPLPPGACPTAGAKCYYLMGSWQDSQGTSWYNLMICQPTG